MAKIRRPDLAKIIGKSPAHINMAVKRGNLIPSGKYIDTKIEENQALLIKWGYDLQLIELAAKKIENEPKPEREQKAKKIPEPKPVIIREKKQKKEPVSQKVIPPKDVPPDYSRAQVKDPDGLAIQKVKAEIEFKKVQTIKSELVNAKMRGESIPTVMVVEVIASLGSGFQREYKNGAESLMLELSHKYKLPSTAVSDLKLKLIKLINTAHERGIDLAKKNLKNVISQVKTVEVQNDIMGL